MAEENIEIVMRASEAWNRRDFDAVIAQAGDAVVVFVIFHGSVPEAAGLGSG